MAALFLLEHRNVCIIPKEKSSEYPLSHGEFFAAIETNIFEDAINIKLSGKLYNLQFLCNAPVIEIIFRNKKMLQNIPE